MGTGAAAFVFWADARADTVGDEDRAVWNRALRAHEKQFRADEKRLAAEPLLRGARGHRDAGPTLARAFPFPHGADLVHVESLIPHVLQQQLTQGRVETFADKIGVVDVSGLDLTWMSTLDDFDIWDLEQAPEIASTRPLQWMRMPLPHFTDASTYGQARLLRGFADGDLARAAHDVENLERLLFTVEISHADFAALGLITWERAAFDVAKKRGIDTGSWQPLDDVSVAALRRALLAYRMYAQPFVDPSISAGLMSSPDAAVGRCTALLEAATEMLMVEPLGPSELAAERAVIAHMLSDTASTCRLARVREALAPHQTSLVVGMDSLCDPATATAESCSTSSFMAHVPGVRALRLEHLVLDPTGVASTFERFDAIVATASTSVP
jgi:hypothetical protein